MRRFALAALLLARVDTSFAQDDSYGYAGLGIGAFGAWMGAAANGAGSGAAGFVYPFGLGLLLDWLHQEHEVLYVAPSESTS